MTTDQIQHQQNAGAPPAAARRIRVVTLMLLLIAAVVIAAGVRAGPESLPQLRIRRLRAVRRLQAGPERGLPVLGVIGSGGIRLQAPPIRSAGSAAARAGCA